MLFYLHWLGVVAGNRQKSLFAEMEDRDCKPDELSYSSLLHAYANAKKLDKMKALSEGIYAERIEPHNWLVKTLVLVNNKVNNLSETEKAFQELRRRRCSLDINVLNAMVSIYGKNKMVKKVEEVLSLMKENSINLSILV
jgi:pentatricopeptide repeat protein